MSGGYASRSSRIDSCYNLAASAPASELTVSLIGGVERPDVSGRGMRKIVDVNYLRNPELRVYLESTDQNIAVVNGLACIETHKAGTLKSVTSSYRILSDFPEQAVVSAGVADGEDEDAVSSN